jgi:DNA-binding CsgD family transcriptional regulator
MKKERIKAVEEKQFNELYFNKKVETKKDWISLFGNTLKEIDNFSSSLTFWYVADFNKGVVEIGGKPELATPLTKKDWLGLHPWDIGKLFHPLDLPKMQAFVVFIAGYYAQLKTSDRNKVKISLIFRMLNNQNKYTWRQMEYPALHYVKNEPRFLLCKVTEIQHILVDPKCIMYIFDSRTSEPTLYFCEDEKVILKPYFSNKALSSREIEVLQLLAKGLISKEIASVLKISKNTVENHKQNIFAKTNTKKVTELVSFANQYLNQL